MGLIADAKHLRKRREFEEMVKEVFGYSVDEIKHKLMMTSKIQFEGVKTVEVSQEVVDKNKENAEKKMTPEQMIAMFAEDVEEFYPDGNAPQHQS